MVRPLSRLLLFPLLVAALLAAPAAAGRLDDDLGRNEVRVWSGPFEIAPAGSPPGGGGPGSTVVELRLPERLERLGYRRRHERPTKPGEYFWGHERFWIYRRPVRLANRRRQARLFGLALRRSDGRVLGGIDEWGKPLAAKYLWLEPELLAESFDPQRAVRQRIVLAELPEIVWQAVLAAEDARFFEHSGMDAKALARATLRNAKAGKVVQGGSTITQQLVKVRDLTPRRTLGRKASEAVRALALEAEYEKTEILEAYLNSIYFGHLDGVAIYGIGTAAGAYFSKPATGLGLGESALLAAVIQGPNRLNPVRNREAALARQRWVLSRLAELEWVDRSAIEAALRAGLPRLAPRPPAPPAAPNFLAWLADEVAERAPQRSAQNRGAVVFSTLDPLLQEAAEATVRRGLADLRAQHSGLRQKPLTAALVALDAASGDILAYVGGDPATRGDAFDRARRARRQPGSAIKPLVLLEAFEACGDEEPLYPARRVSDRPLTVELPSGAWSPVNPDRSNRDAVTVRQATVDSLNVPFVRIARHCGFGATARRLGRAGLPLPAEVPPAFALGAVEVSPLELAAGYTVFATPGDARRPRPVRQILLPGGRPIARLRASSRKVVSPAAAWMIRDLLIDAVREGTAMGAALDGRTAWAKTGTSSEGRDAWLAGGAGSVVAAVWVGLDDGTRLGLSGATAAAPLWRKFMEQAAAARPAVPLPRPPRVVERWIEEATGLLVSGPRSGARQEVFRRGALPPKRRLLRADRPLPVIE